VDRWYRNCVFYAVDVACFQDSNGDGVGDLQGLASRLDYLARLGITAVWLHPIHESPRRDGGYDVVDHYTVDPRFGSLGDFAHLMNEADERGMRIVLDLVLNHTSDEHPWFVDACTSPDSPYRDWYVWSDEEPPDRLDGGVFPGVQRGIWTYHEGAGAWYRHRFYDFEPDLNTSNPAVRAEMLKIVQFWLRLGVAGFRLDAVPFLIERPNGHGGPDFEFLRDLNEGISWRRGDAVLLAEANVPADELLEYFGEADGAVSRLQMLFAFQLNQCLMLSLARADAGPVSDVLRKLPELPRHAQWATFLRNHDEVDIGRLSEEERAEVFAAFGPEPEMQAYGRGLRRRLAPMFDGDQRRLRMSYSLQLSMPGTPVLRYGEEIGMGENLGLEERQAIRTPMQWSSSVNGGFSEAPGHRLIAPVIDSGEYGHTRLNVTDQRRDPDSLLSWMERMLHTRREMPEIGQGDHDTVDVGPHHVLVHRARADGNTVLFLHNLADQACILDLSAVVDDDDEPLDMATDGPYEEPSGLRQVHLHGYGYRWIRLRRNAGGPPFADELGASTQ
jgi:maltose alpha-D-glucosyltransferase / alpha-amylase